MSQDLVTPPPPPKESRLVFAGYISKGGIESRLDGFATFFLVFGWVSGAASLWWAAVSGSGIWVALGVVSILHGLVLTCLFRAGAELIRLLKKSQGLPYTGTITTPQPVWKCSACGRTVDTDYCDCGASFEPSELNPQ